MKLQNAILTPGIVKEVVDNYGTIKATVFGLFSDNEEPDNIPPIYPFFTTLSGTFSTPTVGDKIWVLSVSDNPSELLYLRQPENTVDIKNVINETGENHVELLTNYESNNGWAQLFFDDGTGWIIRNDGVYIKLSTEEAIIDIGMKNRAFQISSDGISLGTIGGSKEKAVMGDSLVKLLNQLNVNIKTLASTAGASPYTTHLCSVINKISSDLDLSTQSILSENVTLD